MIENEIGLVNPGMFKRNRRFEKSLKRTMAGHGISVDDFSVYETSSSNTACTSNLKLFGCAEVAYYDEKNENGIASYSPLRNTVVIRNDKIRMMARTNRCSYQTERIGTGGHEIVHKWQLEEGIPVSELQAWRIQLDNKIRGLRPFLCSFDLLDPMNVINMDDEIVWKPRGAVMDGLLIKYGSREYGELLEWSERVQDEMEKFDICRDLDCESSETVKYYKALAATETKVEKKFKREINAEFNEIFNAPIPREIEHNADVLKRYGAFEIFACLWKGPIIPHYDVADGQVLPANERRNMADLLSVYNKLCKEGFDPATSFSIIAPMGLPSNIRRYAKKNKDPMFRKIMRKNGDFKDFVGVARKVDSDVQTVDAYLRSKGM
jgi:hypothetical protein